MEAQNLSEEDTKAGKGRAQVMNLLTIDTNTVASLATYIWGISNGLIRRKLFPASSADPQWVLVSGSCTSCWASVRLLAFCGFRLLPRSPCGFRRRSTVRYPSACS